VDRPARSVSDRRRRGEPVLLPGRRVLAFPRLEADGTVFNLLAIPMDMPYMSGDDFSVHADECAKQDSGWMPLSDLPDEVNSIEDLECECWDEYESLAEV
jgi:hypothetical protein